MRNIIWPAVKLAALLFAAGLIEPVYAGEPIQPQLVHAGANYNSPVPKTTNFLLQLQFDRTMKTSISPAIKFSNAAPGAVQAKAGANGIWSTTVSTNDTYTTRPITFGPGMDGTVQVLASGAEDPLGNKLALTNVLTLRVLSTPPVVSLVSPTNGASFATTNTITLSASAASSYFLTNLTLYIGTKVAGVSTATNLSLTTNGLPAGSYPIFAVATDSNGTTGTSIVAHVTVNIPGTTLIDFEALDASSGAVTNAKLNQYLAGYGVSERHSTNSTLAVQNDQNILGGTVTVASSGVNLLTQIGTTGAISYTLDFNRPYQSIHWTRTELLAGSGGAIAPEWRAYAYDTKGVEVGSVGEKQANSFTNIPAALFTLAGTNIASVTFAANSNIGVLHSLPLDDLVLSTFPPGANISITLSAEGGANNITAPGQITLQAEASEIGGVISQLSIYENENLLATTTNATNATLGLANLAAGTYTFTTVASDGTYSHTSAPLIVQVAAAAGIQVINFDTLNASGGAVGGTLLSNYLAGFHVSLAKATLGTRLEVVNGDNLSSGASALPSSPPNLFTHAGLNTPVKFSFEFATPVQSFSFTRVGLMAGASGVCHPAWTAYAFDASGQVLETVSEPLIFSFDDVPPRIFQLTGANITRVRFESDSQGKASFSAVLLDDLVLDANPVAHPLSITLNAPKGPFSAGDDITLTASIADTLGGMATMSFYDGVNLIGTALGDSSSIVWTNVPAGTNILTAQVSDSTGYTVTSGTVKVTVTPALGTLAPVVVNFDSLNAAKAPVTGATLAKYLSSFGMTATNLSAGTELAVENQSLLNGGGFVIASSPSNILTQIGSNKTVSFKLRFSPWLTQFAFTRPELEANPFVSQPAWEARAYDALGVLLAQTQENLVSSYTNVPAQSFVLQGAAIATVQFISRGTGLATFDSLIMDDYILTTRSNLPPSVALTNPMPGQIFTAPALIPLEAEAVAARGTVTNVDFYAGTNLVGAAPASPFVFYWSNAPAGAYSLTAVAVDMTGLARTSPPVSVTVHPASNVFGILTQPVGATVASGGSASFDIVTTGTNAVTYQWYQNGANLPGQTQSVLTLDPVSDANAGTYTVVATSFGQRIANGFGQQLTSQDAVLIVLDPPMIGSPPMSQQAQVGGSVILTVSAAGSPPLNYQWLLNGTGIAGATNDNLVLSPAQPLNSGDYQVIVGNPVGSVKSSIAVVSVTEAGGFNESADFFSNRISIDPLVGPVFGNNLNATLEPGEPLPDGKPGGKSIWYTWHAGFDGVISLTTQGSSFDTLLAVYTGTNIAKLTPVAADDDSGGFFTSLVTFNCVAGTDYQIDVDGFRGASGQVVLGLPAGTGYRVLSPASGDSIPVITQQPASQIVPAGAKVTLSVVAASAGPLTYQWFFQNAPIAGASGSKLVIPNFVSGAVGAYYVLVANPVGSVASAVANVQIAAQSNVTGSMAEDKFGDAVDLSTNQGVGGTPARARPEDGGGDTGGFSVAQTFSTVGATKEAGEPDPCGQSGGASEWYIFTTPAAGMFHVDTTGSDFNTLLGVYTSSGSGSPSFATLVEQGCGYTTNYQTDGQPSINLPDVPAKTEFFIVVDGYQGAIGMAQLHIGLGVPPQIVTPPANQFAALGGSATFTVSASGTTNFSYQWLFDSASVAGATNSALSLTNVQTNNFGSYSVVVSNVVGAVTSAPAALMVSSAPAISILIPPASQTVALGKSATFSVSASGTSAFSYQWQFDGANIAKATNSTLKVASVKANSAGSYTVVVSDSQGGVTSVPAVLTPSETTKPTLIVIYPPGNLTTKEPSLTLRGKAGDDLGVTNVELTINSNSTQSALGSNTWTCEVALTPGTNHILVQSYNVDGLASAEVNRTIIYQVFEPLTLLANIIGAGKITGEADQAQLQISHRYTVTAAPFSGFLFSNWIGGTNLGSLTNMGAKPALTFTMITNLILEANFATNPFPAVAGTYHGLFYPTNGTNALSEINSGFLTLTLAAAKGTYSAGLSLAGSPHAFTGEFDLTGNARTNVTGPGKEAVDIDLQIALNTNPPANQITGTVSVAGGWQSALTANRTVFNSANPAAQYAARYTMVIPPGPGAPTNSPGGYGVANITNTPDGVAALVGTLGDGTAFNQTVPLSTNGAIPVYKSLYGGKGLLLGWLTFTNVATNVPPQTLSGSLSWIKPAVGQLYPDGFTLLTNEVIGSFYAPPAKDGSALNLTNATLTITNGSPADTLFYTNITIANDKLTNGAANPTNQLSATFTPGTGMMTLTFRPTGAKASVTAHGVVLQNAGTNAAAGWFLGTNQSGFFLLEP
jgi:hypothetical protein